MKKTLERSKNVIYPKIVHSLDEICKKFKDKSIMDKYGYTLDHDAPFYVGTEETLNYGFTVFKSQYVVDFINKNIEPGSRKFLMDGTFDSLPTGFYQLVIISIEHQNEVSEIPRLSPYVMKKKM